MHYCGMFRALHIWSSSDILYKTTDKLYKRKMQRILNKINSWIAEDFVEYKNNGLSVKTLKLFCQILRLYEHSS
jgi:hypothetical protein